MGGKRPDSEYGVKAAAMYPDFPQGNEAADHLGANVGLVRISDYRLPEQFNGHFWALGPLCNVISHAVRLAKPIPHVGQQGIWRLLPGAQADILQQLKGRSLAMSSFDLSVLGPRP